ncbi:hypothetical protein [Deinococcus misasensis]|uniref:hypothetical protein n=1 Tax=Deinococcus misasensis TaxID=392413 RepID=UPI000A96F4A0|nr:hypothetical protein [Deinococcus misasensis]
MKLTRLEYIILGSLAVLGVLSLINPPVVIRERVVILPSEPAEPETPEEVQE